MTPTTADMSSMQGAAPFARAMFEDVTIVPVVSAHQRVPLGGPIWPRFATQGFARMGRGGVPVDREPEARAPVAHHDEGVWGGYLDTHFGHLMAEHISRLPIARAAWPDKRLFFTVPPGLGRDSLPGYLWDILAFYGVSREQVELVCEPVSVGRLFVCDRGESLPDLGPGAAYLDLVEALEGAPDTMPGSEIVYVTRVGELEKGNGAHLGESYLVERLRALGVTVMDPAALPFDEQMRSYAEARTLVFAEGSALHGRQALGRLPQHIHVLRRRQGRWMAQAFLAPRVQSLSYHDTVQAELMPYFRNGTPRADQTAAIYDLGPLFAVFADLGIDLADGWDTPAFARRVRSDALTWFDAHELDPRQTLSNLDTLAEAGFDLSALDITDPRPAPDARDLH